jgi:hypothetical protein
MGTPEEKLAKVRGFAPEKRPTVRVLSAATAHSDCRFAMLALATRTDLDKLCDGTYFEVAFGQDPQAFQRGQMFERRVKEPAYGALIQLLREKVDFPLASVRIENLRSRTPPNTEGLRQRAAETRRLLRKIARNANDAPNIIDGAVLTCTIAGRIAYYEADSLAAAAGHSLRVVEVKSFPIADDRCDNEKLGAACDQAAWYVLLCRRELIEEGLQPDVVSDEGFIILPKGGRPEPDPFASESRRQDPARREVARDGAGPRGDRVATNRRRAVSRSWHRASGAAGGARKSAGHHRHQLQARLPAGLRDGAALPQPHARCGLCNALRKRCRAAASECANFAPRRRARARR